MLSISLRNIRLHGKHGLYPQEAIIGNEFEVDVVVKMATSAADEWPFVDYAELYKIVAGAFTTPTLLLESLVKEIHRRIKAYAPPGALLRVAIRKLAPPIEGADIESAEVCLEE